MSQPVEITMYPGEAEKHRVISTTEKTVIVGWRTINSGGFLRFVIESDDPRTIPGAYINSSGILDANQRGFLVIILPKPINVPLT